MNLHDFYLTEGKNDSYYAYQDAAKKWAKDTGKDPREFSRAGTDVQDKYIEPEMKKHGLVPDKYMGAGATSYKRESLEALARHVKEGVPLPDSLFRYQSDAYFDTFKTAKKLREAGALPDLDWESEEMLGTDIGESVELKGIGRVWLDVPYLDESDDDDDVNDSGMIGEPDAYYDEEERKQAYDDLQDALDQCNSREHEYVKDGICPECGGSSYMDGDYEGEEDSCYGWGNYGCDEGELEGATWKEIIDHDKKQKEREELRNKPQPSDEELERAVKSLHKDQVQTGKANAFELPSLLRQVYPEISKPKAREIGSKFLQSFGESITENYDPKLVSMLAKFEDDCEEQFRYYGDTDMVKIDELLKAGKAEEAADEMATVMSDQDGGSSKHDQIYDLALERVQDYMHEPAMAEMRKLAGLSEAPSDAVWALFIDDKDTQTRFASWAEAGRHEDEFKKKYPNKKVEVKQVDEAKGDIRKGLATAGLAGALAFGGGAALDATSAKNTPLGKELTAAAQAGDQVAAYHLKNLDLYVDASDSRTLKNLEIAYVDDSPRDDVKAYLAKKAGVNEAEYNGKKVQLNKPKRGGSKKYYVYVKNPKTGRVKKISFGDVTGLKTKSGNKKRAKSFAARHNCEKKNDKMKAGYWACRLPRYGLVKGGQWW